MFIFLSTSPILSIILYLCKQLPVLLTCRLLTWVSSWWLLTRIPTVGWLLTWIATGGLLTWVTSRLPWVTTILWLTWVTSWWWCLKKKQLSLLREILQFTCIFLCQTGETLTVLYPIKKKSLI